MASPLFPNVREMIERLLLFHLMSLPQGTVALSNAPVTPSDKNKHPNLLNACRKERVYILHISGKPNRS